MRGCDGGFVAGAAARGFGVVTGEAGVSGAALEAVGCALDASQDCLHMQGLPGSAINHTELCKAAAGSGDRCAAARIEQLCKVKCNIFCLAKGFGYLCLLTYSLFHKLFGYVRKTRPVQHVYLCSSYPTDVSQTY